MNILENVSVNLRNNFHSNNSIIVYNSNTVPQPIDLNIYGTNFYSKTRFINVICECGTDNFGQYLKIRRNSPDTQYQYGINCKLTKEYLRSLNLPAGKYTIQMIAESNLGGAASGTSVTVTGYNYQIDGRDHEAVVEVKYTTDMYQILYVSSVNLHYDPSKHTIHYNYNKWVRTLNAYIYKKL